MPSSKSGLPLPLNFFSFPFKWCYVPSTVCSFLLSWTMCVLILCRVSVCSPFLRCLFPFLPFPHVKIINVSSSMKPFMILQIELMYHSIDIYFSVMKTIIASLTQWTQVWANSRRWWRTGKPGVLQFMGSQRVGHDWVTRRCNELVVTWQTHLPISAALTLDHF